MSITLCYGLPSWHKTNIITPEIDPNVKLGPGGITEDLIVGVSCDNGEEFISMDRYDPHTKSWEKHTSERGQHVLAWCKLDIPWM